MTGEPTPPLRLPASQRFIAAWHGWRAGRLVPRRADMRIADIKDLLPMIAVLEIGPAEEIRYRLAGTGLREYFGFDLTGRSYRDVISQEQWPVRLHRMRQNAAHPCGGVAFYAIPQKSGDAVAAEAVGLPVEAGGGQPPQVIMHVGLAIRVRDAMIGADTDRARLPDRFSFFDIGAGVPARDVP